MIAWTSPTASGERVVVWCRAGTSAGDFVEARAVLASACWARDLVVVPSERYAHVVTLHVRRLRATAHDGEPPLASEGGYTWTVPPG